MNLRATLSRTLVFLVVLSATFFPSCNRREKIEIDPAFAQYISAFTSGSVSVAGKVRIRFTQPFVEGVQPETPVKEEILKFSPSISGELVWLDNQTLEFRPSEWLAQGEVYEATLELDKITAVPENLQEFEFSFTTLKQFADASITSVAPYSGTDLSKMELRGEMRTADVAKSELIESTLTATQKGKKLPVIWQHSDDMHAHYFIVDSIARGEKADSVQIQWNGKPIGAEQSGKMNQNIPALGDFKVFFFRAVQQPEQYIVLQFSDPLEATQDLNGLIDLQESESERFEIENNEVRIYPPYRLNSTVVVSVYPGVRNIMGYASKESQEIVVQFEDLKPQVEIGESNRVILPSTDGMVFPFRAVNLSAVDVRILRVYENNIPQFLQVNELTGSSEMKRVGRQIAKATVPLNPGGNKDLAQWNTFYLNLDEYIRTEPGALYRVEIGFRRSQSLYPCDDSTSTEEDSAEEESWDTAEGESSYWDYFDDYWYGEYYDDYYDWDWDWDEKDNPCNKAYFKNRRPEGRNILASDIGLIAKRGTDQSLTCFVTNIKSTDAMSDVTVEVLNYQQQVIGSGKTNGEGKVEIAKVDGVPFLIVAKKGKQTGYIKMDSGHSLSVSTFDVGGSATEKGMKGLIYGDRGVWRPGDTLFLTFMLQENVQALPQGHPVQFELKDPRGKEVYKAVKTINPTGVYNLTCTTSPDAPTGTWNAQVRVGGATFSKPLRIETIKPNRLKLSLDFGKERITSLDQKLNGVLTAKWLHGAVAKNLKANVSATFSMGATKFDRFADYKFDDPVRTFISEEQVIFDGKVDQDGKATIPMNITLGDLAPGMVNANFSIKVFEEGGDFSVDRFSIPYAPFDRFVGVRLPKGDASRGMLLTDTDHKAEIITVDANGKPVAVKGLQWRLYKINWRWWWEKGSDELTNFVGSESTVPLAEGNLNTAADGKGSFKFRVNYPDWGRYLVRIEDAEGGHATGSTVYIDWPGWAGRPQNENPGGASMLLFALDKEKYEVGQECTVTIPGNDQGRILISIENGSRVLESHWVTPEKGQTRFTFRTTKEMAPNAYVHITYLQPHAQSVNDMPIRLYGIQPLFVEYKDSHIDPVITMANELAPEKAFDVKVCEKNGKGMTYTLAIVDEGLLDLTRFKTPDPWSHFYAREALGVSTYDMYDEVIGALSTKPDRLLSIGGSDEEGKKGKNQVNRFKPVVIYEGPFTLKPGECKTHSLTMPNYVGSVRVMVVARNENAYGNTEKTVPVKKPLMVLASLPRVLGPGETAQLPVTLFAMDKQIKDATIRIESNDLIQIEGDAQRNVKFTAPGDQVINFPVKVAMREGKGTVKVTATSGTFKSTYEIELEVRSPNAYQTTFIESVVDNGKSWSPQFDLTGIAGTNSAVLEVSTMPAIDFGRRLKYLLDYPHGCLEQTTSGAFPQLYLSDVLDLDEKARKRAEDNVRAGIKKVMAYQNSNGGFGYWPGANEEDLWATSYVGHFLLEAKKKGYTLPSSFESSWVNFQKKAAQNWRAPATTPDTWSQLHSELDQAYRLYTLALAGKPELSAMNRLKERPGLTPAARWRLAAAYAIAGQKSTATNMIKGIAADAQPYPEWGTTYGSETRDEAMIVETLVLLDDRNAAAPLVKTLSARLSSGEWYSTQSTAYALLAVSRFAAKELGKKIVYTLAVNGKSQPEVISNKPVLQRTLDVKLKGNSISLKNNSGNMLYARIILSGKPAAGDEQAVSSGLTLSVVYQTIDGKPVNISRMEQGTDFYAIATVSHTGVRRAYSELALTQIFPSGWEIINSRMDAYAASDARDIPEYQDVRDDRVFTYFDLLPSKSRSYRLKLNATYLGKFYLPGFVCEAMYDKSIQARTKGQWVEVVSPGVTASAK
jgi:alpha-2-macroglobulin